MLLSGTKHYALCIAAKPEKWEYTKNMLNQVSEKWNINIMLFSESLFQSDKKVLSHSSLLHSYTVIKLFSFPRHLTDY